MTEEQKGGSINLESKGAITLEHVNAPAQQKRSGPVEVRGIKVSMTTELAIRFGIVGAGQGGSRIAEAFSSLGYPTIVINTAKQDLEFIKVPNDRKLHMEYGLGGAGKDLTIGAEAFLTYQEQVKALLDKAFNGGASVDYLLACVGGGGGTGSGSAPALVKLLASYGLPVGVVFTLPQANEDGLTKANAIKTLDQLSKLVREKVLTTLIVVDNAKIERTYPGLSAVAFWQKANMDIANILHQFNRLTAQPSRFISFDPMDFAKVITEGNCTIYGSSRISEYQGPEQLAKSLVDSVRAGLLADEFKIDETTIAGVLFAGSFDVLSVIPQEDIDYALYELSKITGQPAIYKGIYDLDVSDIGRGLVSYTVLSGLGIPHKRVEGLAQESKEEAAVIEAKKGDSSKMGVTDNDSAVSDKDRFKKMEVQHSVLGKMMRNRKPNP